MNTIDWRYREQMKALNEIADAFGIVAYRPNYHATNGDKNTVLFYTKEDAAHNQEVEAQPTQYTSSVAFYMGTQLGRKIDPKYVYRDSLFCFENSDVNGFMDYGFANHGTIDLRGSEWKKRLEGHIEIAIIKHRMIDYIRGSGGILELRESDEPYNSLNRSLITAFHKAFSHVYLGRINYYSDDRIEVSKGNKEVFEEYTGKHILNFEYDFVVPKCDRQLQDMIRKWNGGEVPEVALGGVELMERIVKRIKSLGGENFVWF